MIDARTPGADGAFVITELPPSRRQDAYAFWQAGTWQVRVGTPDPPWDAAWRFRLDEMVGMSVRTPGPGAYVEMTFL